MTDTTATAQQRRTRDPRAAAFLRPRPRNPYRVPRPAVISFSGGRTSAYMLRRVIDAYGGRLPQDVVVVYANTGMERPETLEFVDVCARAWAVQIQWVEYFWDAPHRTRLVDYRTASRNGEPYAALIDRKGFVPSVSIRFCSGFLKRDRIESYARHWLALKRWHSVIGLRADEPRRVWRMRAMNCGSRTGARASLPLADAGVRQADVIEWWKRQPFDLGIPSYAGNCTLCMLKGRAKLIRLIREDPTLADWWIQQEARVADRTGPDGRACDSMKVFRLGETYAELKASALADRDLFDEAAAATDEDGQSDSLDCSCTD